MRLHSGEALRAPVWPHALGRARYGSNRTFGMWLPLMGEHTLAVQEAWSCSTYYRQKSGKQGGMRMSPQQQGQRKRRISRNEPLKLLLRIGSRKRAGRRASGSRKKKGTS